MKSKNREIKKSKYLKIKIQLKKSETMFLRPCFVSKIGHVVSLFLSVVPEKLGNM